MSTILIVLLSVTWMLPQTLIGLCLGLGTFALKRLPGKPYKKAWIIHWKRYGVSLGLFIFTDENNRQNVQHEYGHFKQSLMLGPLYLLIVGLPSFIRASVWYLYKKDIAEWYYKKSYYCGYPERWADKLGGVKRIWNCSTRGDSIP